MLQSAQTLGQRLFRGSSHYQDGRWVGVLLAAVKGEFRTFTDGLQKELGTFCLGGYPRRHGCATFRIILTPFGAAHSDLASGSEKRLVLHPQTCSHNESQLIVDSTFGFALKLCASGIID